jgi:diaminopimelate decarboxylase
LDASAISSMMRPPMYRAAGGGYHHITVFGGQAGIRQRLQVVGSACEDNDRFGWDRLLCLHEGDIVIVHDTGAHCQVMGNNYNFRLAPQELMLRTNGFVELIKPAQTVEDYLRRFQFEGHFFQPRRA